MKRSKLIDWCREGQDDISYLKDCADELERMEKEIEKLQKEFLYVLQRVGFGELLDAGIDPDHLRDIVPGAEKITAEFSYFSEGNQS